MQAAIGLISLRFRGVDHVDPATLENWMAGDDARRSGITVADGRREDEYDVSHLPRSTRLHFGAKDDELLRFLEEAKNEGGRVICYCSLGYRSAILVNRLKGMASREPDLNGMKFYNLEGGIFNWANQNRHMEDRNGVTTRFVHPFSHGFGLLLDRDRRRWMRPGERDTTTFSTQNCP